MKFEIMRDRLLDGLNDVMKAISQKVAIPILTGIKIEVDEKGITMTGSDSDITICTFIPAEDNGEQIIKVTEKGSIVLQAKVFSEIARKLPTNEVTIEVASGLQTHIHSGKSEFHLIGSDASNTAVLCRFFVRRIVADGREEPGSPARRASPVPCRQDEDGPRRREEKQCGDAFGKGDKAGA